MSELNVTEVRDMAYDLYKGRTANFDAESANEAIKNIILETAGIVITKFPLVNATAVLITNLSHNLHTFLQAITFYLLK